MKKKILVALSALLIVSSVVSPVSHATQKGVTVTSESGVETIFSADVELVPLETGDRIKVNSLLHYTLSDFIDMKTAKATDKLDPDAKRAAKQLAGTNWYQAPSLTGILSRLVSGDNIEEGTEEETVADDYDYDYEYDDDEASYGSSSTTRYSTTNVQVKGVDEADIIKTDGKNIYYLQPSNGIAIFDISGTKPKQVAMLKPNAKIGENLPKYENLYISGNNLIIISNKTNVNIYEGVKADQNNLPMSMYESNRQNYVAVDVYDISNPSKPKLTRQVNVEGSASTTRLYNNTVYFVLDMQINAYGDSAIIDIMPKYQDSALGNEFYIMSPKDIYLNVYPDRMNIPLTAVGAIDLSNPSKPLQLAAYEFPSGQALLYMNKNNLYLTSGIPTRSKYSANITKGMKDVFVQPAADTMIARFSLNAGGYSFGKTAGVAGSIYDKYCLDESNGTLRVLTARYSKNNLYLDLYTLNAATMSKTGELKGYQSSKYSYLTGVRFRGDTVYVTTGSTFDPMLILDVSNPASPKKSGSLALKGFTGYLHPYKSNYLIGVGTHVENTYVKDKDGKMKHVAYRDSGVEFTLYDVSNAKQPKIAGTLVVGGPQSGTIGMTNPKTIMFDEQKGTMTMPFVFKDGEIKAEGEDPETTTWSGGLVLQITDKGFKESARIELSDYFDNSALSRFAYVDDTLYYVTGNYLIALDYNRYNIKHALPIVY